MLSDLNAHLRRDVTEALHLLEMVLAVVASIMVERMIEVDLVTSRCVARTRVIVEHVIFNIEILHCFSKMDH